jgi:DNA-binding beta-propeller fold protein YncE
MRTIYFSTIFVLLHCLNLLGQVEATEVVAGFETPASLAFHGNDLYIAEPEGDRILKVDLSASTPVATDFITEGLVLPSGLVVHENNLYISEFNEIEFRSSRILKVDLTAATPEAAEVVGGLAQLELMLIHGNDLYVSQSTSSDNIFKIDLTAETPVITDVVSANGPVGLAIYGNELYIASNGNEKIAKIDLTAETPVITDVVSVSSPTGLAVYGNELYIASNDYENKKIVKIDLTAETPVPTDVLTTGLKSLRQLVVVDDILYIGDVGDDDDDEDDSGRVLKLDLTTLSIDEIPTEFSSIRISPNPATDFIQVSGLKAIEKYAIYNVLGAEIKSGEVFKNEEIDVTSLSKGLYFMKLESGGAYQFIKEETK